MNMMSSMLKSTDLPKYLLVEAICGACYMKNGFTSSKKPTYFEVRLGGKPDISQFRISG